MNTTSWWHNQDVGNMVLFEHVFFKVPDAHLAKLFYVDALGCTLDPFDHAPSPYITWYNIGFQQFHINWKKDLPADVMEGHVGLIVPSLHRAFEKLSKGAQYLRSTKFKFSMIDEAASEEYKPIPILGFDRYISVECPWGNRFRLYENSDALRFRASTGIAYVETLCMPNTFDAIADFYRYYLNTFAAKEETAAGAVLRVCAGVRQQLIFREKNADDNDHKLTEREDVSGFGHHHICYYVANFSMTYNRLQEEHLVGEKRYEENYHERYETLDDALKLRQLRFERMEYKGQRLMVLEQEVRSMYNPLFMRVLVNSAATEGLYCRQ